MYDWVGVVVEDVQHLGVGLVEVFLFDDNVADGEHLQGCFGVFFEVVFGEVDQVVAGSLFLEYLRRLVWQSSLSAWKLRNLELPLRTILNYEFEITEKRLDL